MNSNTAVIYVLLMLATAMGGCLAGIHSPDQDGSAMATSGPHVLECPPIQGETWPEAKEHVEKKHMAEEALTAPSSTLGVFALRDASGHHSKDSSRTTMEWSWYPNDERPSLIDDLLCLSSWRYDNQPSLGNGSLWTQISVSRGVVDAALEKMQADARQLFGIEVTCPFFINSGGIQYAIQENFLTINYIHYSTDIYITRVVTDAPGSGFVQILNTGPNDQNLSNWALSHGSNEFNFPSNFTMPPESSVWIIAGAGRSNATHLYWNTAGRVWYDQGAMFLRDSEFRLRHEVIVQDLERPRICRPAV